MASSSFLLKAADETVLLLQGLITILNDFYEVNIRDMSSHTGRSSCMLNLDVVQLNCHTLQQNLATLWPCEKQFIAVLGRTGCGKSTLLNLLLSMMCVTSDIYEHGINVGSARAVLRDTARIHGEIVWQSINKATGEEEESMQDALEEPRLLFDNTSIAHVVNNDLIISEQRSVAGLLGICCAEDRQSYMSKHIPDYDESPFLLRNGRMGSAGTTKVTAIEYGPKFVGHVRWMTGRKLRKKLRDLRQSLDKPDQATNDEKSIAELREFWNCICEIVNILDSSEKPTERQIDRVVDVLRNKEQVLDKEEVIGIAKSKGCTIDRIFVREGMKQKLSQQLGRLVEDLRIEVPVPSFEGGVSLLDVPGTNDPRALHQRETRDAIDRTSLILLVLDKSVMDVQTEESLVESPLLERMLMDETAQCSLIVVGIAEKDSKKGQTPRVLIDGFDPKKNILNILKKVFRKISARLCRNKRIGIENARSRMDNLFSNSIHLIPVLPFLCASLHLSASNSKLHKVYCESKTHESCPLSMSKEQLKERCIETNIPQLLERLHSVRVPPKLDDLCCCIKSTKQGLKLLTQQTVLDPSYIKFLKREWKQAKIVAESEVHLRQGPDNCGDLDMINNLLDEFAERCQLQPKEIQEINNSIEEELLSQLQTGRFPFGPYIAQGFKPEVIGLNAQELLRSVDQVSQHYIQKALDNLLIFLKGGEARIEASLEKVEEDSVGPAVDLYAQLYSRWHLSLQRLRARCFCGGADGGLVGQVREVLRNAYFRGLKYFYKQIMQGSRSENRKDCFCTLLSKNVVGLYAAHFAKPEIKVSVEAFWSTLCELANKELKLLWKAWRKQIKLLATSAAESRDLNCNDDRLKEFQEKITVKLQDLESLLEQLDKPREILQGDFSYGYSLLHHDSRFCSVLMDDGTRDGVALSSPEVHKVNSEVLKDNFEGYRVQEARTQVTMGNEHLQSDVGHDKTCISPSEVTRETLGDVPRPSASRLAPLAKARRKAQVLTEAESHKLQRRESFVNRPKR